MSYSTLGGSQSTISSDNVPGGLDKLRMHHTQALVNAVSAALYPDAIDTAQLYGALVELRRHLESPLAAMHAHPVTETNAAEVAEHILLCWVCARASQADAQNYSLETIVETVDRRFDKYAGIPEQSVSETIQCVSYLATMGVGVAAVAQTSIPASLVLLLSFAECPDVYTSAFRTLAKLCTKHSVRRAQADGRWESESGRHAVLDAFTRAQTALRLRNRFDSVATCLFALVSELASAHYAYKLTPQSTKAADGSTPQRVDRAERAVTSALAFTNALVEAHSSADGRLRMRQELLDTALHRSLTLLDGPEFESSRIRMEIRRFRRAYADDIRARDPQPAS
ncbi:hypothetical protein LPJ70_005578 [Coemansia sp. RSA 2708]|nr:hypothetical protein LPJ70_005578 [Coemansia sp. RSA 2708]KAJ2310760.1 hypothetical protein IWW52_005322 [Coemansia sp. RSA 2704]KAJ2717665.1 hypothetical protein H4R23_005246 [Coemansia sp. Cherry 401B]